MKHSPDDLDNESCDISDVAFRLWQEAGRPPGRYMEFWMKATRLVMDAQKALDGLRASKPTSVEAGARNN